MWREFLKFANCGALGTTAHYIVLWLLVNGGALDPVLGSAAGAVVGAGTNYFLNYHWTFGSRLPHSRTMPRFIAIAVLSLAVNTWLMALLLSYGTLHYLLAQIIATLVCLAFNYFASRFWAFQESSR